MCQSGGADRTFLPLTSTNVPPARSYHSMTTLTENTALVFGGEGSNNVLLNDVWLLDVSNATAVWTLNPSVGDAPTGRYTHTMTTLSESTALVFGGVESDGVLLDDVWLLDPVKCHCRMDPSPFCGSRSSGSSRAHQDDALRGHGTGVSAAKKAKTSP